MEKLIFALTVSLFFSGCYGDHTPVTPMCETRTFASLRNECSFAPDMCRTCPAAEDAFYVAAARLGCDCPVFDCGAWWPTVGTPAVYENATSCSNLLEMMHDPTPWTNP